MKRLALCAILAMAGCGTTVEMNKTVTAKVRSEPQNQFQSQGTVIRSSKVDENGKRVDFSGAVCSGGNALVSFSGLVTPAAVVLPVYLQGERFPSRGKPPSLKIKCTYDGRSVSFSQDAVSATSNQTSLGAGTYDPSTGVYSQPTVTSLNHRLSSTMPWRYPSVQARF